MAVPGVRTLAARSSIVALLAGCGSTGDDGAHQHTNTTIETAGRLALIEAGSTSVRIFDLDSKSTARSFEMANPPSAIYASPDKRYALAVQREQNRVQLIDGGIWQEDHGDHPHDYKDAPEQSSYVLTGARPTHYEAHDRIAAFFMDGHADSGHKAGVRLVSDASLGKAETEASLELPTHMHGTAEPRGTYLLTTFRPPETTDTLPTHVELYRRNGTGFSFVQRFDIACPALHGSFSNTLHTVFGCGDGVLVITQTGDAFSAKKIANTTEVPTGVRIGTIVGHHERANFVGLASPGYLYEIDPAAGTMRRIAWAEGRTRRAHSFDGEGANFLVVDDHGVAHVLDATGSFAVRSAIPIVSTMPDAAPFPSIVASGAGDRVYVTDPVARSVAVIDTKSLQVSERLALDFSPSAAAWLGISRHAH